MSTPTPRTDAKVVICNYGEERVTADFARTLERELATCKESLHLADGTANLALVDRDAAEAEVRVLRLACERIVEQWDKNHDAAPFHAGNVMYSRASAALAATESENGGSNE